jgi:chromosomal replication initiator protein
LIVVLAPEVVESRMSVEVWHRVLESLRGDTSPESFANWLEPLEYDCTDSNGVMHLLAPNDNVKSWLEDEFGPRILKAVQTVDVAITTVQLSVQRELAPVSPTLAAPARQQTFQFRDRTARFSPRYTFDSFVVGSCNEFAHAAAQAVAANPANAYNPLYIYGDVGMGKTHLMHAIGQQLLDSYPQMRVVYVSSEEFMNEMINSLRYDRMSSFHERFRAADTLLIDDIQTLGTRERTQEEFFHTFNALHNMQKQIVISSDLPPKQVPGLVDRLRSRFTWGLMADIQPPDIETKMAILSRKADELHLDLPDSVRSYLATHLKSNIRELEGALLRLSAVSSVSEVDVNLPMAKQALKGLIGNDNETLSIENIQTAVAEEFNLKTYQLREKSNAKAIVFPRQVAMYLCKEILGNSFPHIGKVFGGKHHTTVLYAVKKIERQRRLDPALNTVIHKLTDRFN